MSTPLVAVGDRFDRLVVVGVDAGRGTRGARLIACRCDCGADAVVQQGHLRSGHTRSCGCLYRESRRRAIHGHSRESGNTPTRQSWLAMINRCTYPSQRSWASYGGRGITVCERWLEPRGQGFINFLADMGERPAGTTLDRIDVDGNYEPGNCRWATASEQRQNQRRAA